MDTDTARKVLAEMMDVPRERVYRTSLVRDFGIAPGEFARRLTDRFGGTWEVTKKTSMQSLLDKLVTRGDSKGR